jgi:hypothetical protein
MDLLPMRTDQDALDEQDYCGMDKIRFSYSFDPGGNGIFFAFWTERIFYRNAVVVKCV